MNDTLSFYKAGSVVGTLKPYLMKKNLFELFTLIGEDAKTSGASTRTQQSPLWIFHSIYIMFFGRTTTSCEVKVYLHEMSASP